MKKIIVASLVLMGVASTAFAAENPDAVGNADRGHKLSSTCAACHGADGNSVAPNFPKLAGQNETYLIKELHDFKSGKRKDPIMTGMAAGLDDSKIADLAAYFSSQTTKIGSADKKLVKLGQQVYRGGNKDDGVAACMACHGPDGAGNLPAAYPRLSGQHATYVEKALNDFKDGKRTNDPNHMMRDTAAKLTPAEIHAVASYVEGLY